MEKMENFFSFKNSGKTWIKSLGSFIKSPSGILLLAIIFLASFMRLYKISEYMTFLGDEGRDALVAKDILEGNLTLLGPRASAGDFFLGPVYYYMIAPFLALTNYDPVGPAIMVALFGIGTVFLVYYFTQKFFGKIAGLSAAALYAVSPVVIAFSRSSWNPNPVPFFALLLMLVLYYSVKRNSLKLSVGVGFLLSILLQLHYIAVFIGVIIFAFVLFGNLFADKKVLIKKCFLQYISIFAGFMLGIFPFLIFEIKHGFPNIRTIFSFIFIDNFQVEKIKELSHMEIVWDVLFRLFARLTLNYPPIEQLISFDKTHLLILQIITIALILGSITSLFFVKNKLVLLLLITWSAVGLFLFGFYKKEIYDYYFGFMFPLPFILIGNMVGALLSLKNKLKYPGIISGGVIFAGLFVVLILNNPFQYQGNNQKREAERIANKVIEVTEGKPYNFALITNGNSDHVFRYFLEINHRAPVVIENLEADPERKSVTDQLIVICDSECSPVGHPLWEVAGFGRAEIVGEWGVPFVTIYKLVPFEE